MSCSPYDLRDYLYKELTPAQRGEVRVHLKSCDPCTAELQSLRLTQSALLALRDEDMPQRIGFISDKVFEPSPVRRWLNGFWTSAARLGFVSAVMLSAALFVHTLRPAQIVHKDAQPVTLSQAEIDRRIHDAVATQVAAAVTQAVAQTEQAAQKRTIALLAAAEKRDAIERQSLRTEFAQSLEYSHIKSNMGLMAQNYGAGQ